MTYSFLRKFLGTRFARESNASPVAAGLEKALITEIRDCLAGSRALGL